MTGSADDWTKRELGPIFERPSYQLTKERLAMMVKDLEPGDSLTVLRLESGHIRVTKVPAKIRDQGGIFP